MTRLQDKVKHSTKSGKDIIGWTGSSRLITPLQISCGKPLQAKSVFLKSQHVKKIALC